MKHQFTAQIEKDKETGLYTGFIPNLPGAHTQGESLDELYINLREVAELYLEECTEEELNQIPELILKSNVISKETSLPEKGREVTYVP